MHRRGRRHTWRKTRLHYQLDFKWKPDSARNRDSETTKGLLIWAGKTGQREKKGGTFKLPVTRAAVHGEWDLTARCRRKATPNFQ